MIDWEYMRPGRTSYEFTNAELMEAAQRLALEGEVPTPDPDDPDLVDACLRAEADVMRQEKLDGWIA